MKQNRVFIQFSEERRILFSDERSIAQNVVESTAAGHTEQEAWTSQTQPLDTSEIPFAIGEMHEVLPPDQLRMIHNINSLISEVFSLHS
jgi:hypothetical protein